MELRKQTAREARLLAELDESAKISFPAGFAADSGNRTLIRDEEMAFKARSEALGAQVEGAQRLVELFRNEITALAAKTKAQDRQLELINKEKDSITSLVQKGLAVAPRQYLLERTAAEIESKRLDLDTSALRARQEMVKAERSIIDFRNDRRREVLDLLQDARARKADAAQRAETAQLLVQEAEVIAPRLLADRQRMLSARPVYRLIRQDAGGTHESIVAETAALRPGDIVKVETGDPDERLATALGPTGTTR